MLQMHENVSASGKAFTLSHMQTLYHTFYENIMAKGGTAELLSNDYIMVKEEIALPHFTLGHNVF